MVEKDLVELLVAVVEEDVVDEGIRSVSVLEKVVKLFVVEFGYKGPVLYNTVAGARSDSRQTAGELGAVPCYIETV